MTKTDPRAKLGLLQRNTLRAYALAAISATSLIDCGSQIPSLKEWADQSIGRPISEIRAMDRRVGSYASRISWTEMTYFIENGNWVYVHPDRPQCEIHFEVNSDGNVVGYMPIGEGCRGQ